MLSLLLKECGVLLDVAPDDERPEYKKDGRCKDSEADQH
jgi:hypothetical protein